MRRHQQGTHLLLPPLHPFPAPSLLVLLLDLCQWVTDSLWDTFLHIIAQNYLRKSLTCVVFCCWSHSRKQVTQEFEQKPSLCKLVGDIGRGTETHRGTGKGLKPSPISIKKQRGTMKLAPLPAERDVSELRQSPSKGWGFLLYTRRWRYSCLVTLVPWISTRQQCPLWVPTLQMDVKSRFQNSYGSEGTEKSLMFNLFGLTKKGLCWLVPF